MGEATQLGDNLISELTTNLSITKKRRWEVLAEEKSDFTMEMAEGSTKKMKLLEGAGPRKALKSQ